MRLTRHTDYAIRVLLYLGSQPDRLCSIAEIARAHGISQSHLMKVVSALVRTGYVASVRGRFGGIRLARPPGEIRIGPVIRATKDRFDLVDCARCIVAPPCGLTDLLQEALAAFMTVLDDHSLIDLMEGESLAGPAEALRSPARPVGRS